MVQTFQVTGELTAIEEAVIFSEKYTERAFMVKYSSGEAFSNDAGLILSNNRIGMIDDFSIGDNLIVHFNVASRKVKGNYYTKLNVWKIELQR